jgi:quinol monooxygenase YgiN
MAGARDGRGLWSSDPTEEEHMTTVHVQNKVRDFDTWKAAFDKYERFRADQGVLAYRVSRGVSAPDTVIVDLEFSDQSAAEAFLPKLADIMASPQAKDQLIHHEQPSLYTIVTDTSR